MAVKTKGESRERDGVATQLPENGVMPGSVRRAESQVERNTCFRRWV